MDSLIILHFRVIRTYAGNKSMLIFDAQLSPRYASASATRLIGINYFYHYCIYYTSNICSYAVS